MREGEYIGKRLLQATLATAFFIIYFYSFSLLGRLATALSMFRFRLKWVAHSYLPLPSPHIPIAALAANRVIIIVINITFYLLKPLNLLKT